jgi:(E)-4-hydroxy-3-methylbut-2-enyl-diphosphate synthase
MVGQAAAARTRRAAAVTPPFITRTLNTPNALPPAPPPPKAFTPLVLKCKELGRAMRIGTNHGSLSARILSFYGDTPRGMVESAFEFAEICRKHDYHNFLFSMKASNPLVMVSAYRLLSEEMYAKGWDYPIHLGVTEAGEGEDGRMKSAIGIGALLMDGIGDTIRWVMIGGVGWGLGGV